MSEKYAKEMILLPKPPTNEPQVGGQATQDAMDQFWQRRLFVDQLLNAPRVDRMTKILNDMKQVEGRAVPSSIPGDGPDSSDYFRLQRQIQNMKPHAVKSISKPKRVTPLTFPAEKRSTRPPPSRSAKEALDQRAQIEETLQRFKQRAEQEMERALNQRDEEKIKEAQRKWDIVNYNIEEIRKEDDLLNAADEPSWFDELYLGKEEAKQTRSRTREDATHRRDKLYRQLERFYPKQRGQGYKPIVWQKPRQWIQE